MRHWIREVSVGDRGDDRGVSAVIDDLLLVGIVLILATIAAAYGLGLTELVAQDTPQASLGISDHGDAYAPVAGTGIFVIGHNSGDDLVASETRIVIRNTTNEEIVADLHAGNGFNASSTNVTLNDATTSFDGGTFQTGDILRVNVDSPANQGFSAGLKYEVLVIDRESEQLVARRLVQLS